MDEQKLVNALCVFLLDHRIRAFLDKHDPKSVEQAVRALGFDPKDRVPVATTPIAGTDCC